MKETGMVVSAEGGTARVQFVPTDACEHCGAKGFCHPSPGKMVAEVVNELEARPGDEVTIETEASASVLAAGLVFLVPIAGLIGGYLVARWFLDSEGAGAIGGILLMVLLVAVLAYLDRRVFRPKRFMPRITSVVRKEVKDMPKDPVCGMEVSEDTTFKTEHAAKTYYFCCEACKVKFDENPGEYVKEE
ncbi:MAG: SoxR reducing system RseC family protein [bacterium]